LSTFSHYEIEERIASGGTGDVYLARDRTLDRRVALKFLSERLRQDESTRMRFLQEARSAAALDHPYICKIYETGEAEGRPFIAMEYVPGESLEERLDREALPIEEALAAAEERGLDLVEVAPTARPPVVKIMDYGKFKFEEAKAARAAKKKQHVIEIKEVKFRPSIDEHDFGFKIRHMREFLNEGNKVKVTMMFRGRQMARLDLGKAVLDRVATALADIGKIEFDARLEGKNMTMVIAPK